MFMHLKKMIIFNLERFDMMKQLGCYYLVCIESSDEVVACATLIVEHKFLHNCGQVK